MTTRAPVTLPDRAYVPGLSPRHPEGAFDSLRATARPGMSAVALSDCAAFHAGLAFREAGFFWEAHEVLEPVWMALPEGSEARALVQGLIQLANAGFKLQMGRPKAALRLCDIAQDHFATLRESVVMGQDLRALRREVQALADRAKSEL